MSDGVAGAMLDGSPASRLGVPVVSPDLREALARHGLRVRGGFATEGGLDEAVFTVAPWARSLIMVGNVGSELWDKSGAEIAAMAGLDPLDQWTRQTIDPIARSIGGTALYPFDGPPYWPFQRWAERAEGVRSSPLGIQIHPEYGLWHAYRAAILLRTAFGQPLAEQAHPCDSCVGRPCLTRCPVSAFSPDGYDVELCVNHVVAMQHEGGSCADVGCLARLACPVGARWRYRADHASFHMTAFVTARLRARERNS